MIPLILQDELVERIKAEFESFTLKNLKGETVPIQVFSQHLPAKSKEKDVSPYPCIVIRLADGSETNGEDPQGAKVLFIVGTVDRDSNNQGYRDAINVIQKIYQNLKRNPFVDNKFEMVYPINWAYHDEDAEPYYFAGLETNWEIPRISREDLEGII
jgi:hypothetical protein